MQFSHLLFASFVVQLSAAQTVYLIRHGEKPSDGGDGLSAKGEQCAQCLRAVFGASSGYDIGYNIAEQPKSSWSPSSLSRGLLTNPSFRIPRVN
jgi:hypothetical protein